MIPKDDPLLQEVTAALRQQQAPQVDVTQRVMDSLPTLLTPTRTAPWRIVEQISIAAAACLLLAVVLNLTRLLPRHYDDAAIGNMIAQTNNPDVYFDSYTDYESAIGHEYASLF